jgi:prepilin-type N-terminal cleavage/methylation domain-containing protein
MNMNISRKIRSKSGFTLIEVIVALILAGILAAVAGIGLVYVVQGFVFTRANAATLQKGQMAMSRITLELKNISLVSSPSTVSSLTYYSFKNDVKSKRSIQLNGDEVGITESYTDGAANTYLPLTDQVEANTGLELKYYNYKEDPTTNQWILEECYPPSAKIIQIKLRLVGADGSIMELVDRVTPRNI